MDERQGAVDPFGHESQQLGLVGDGPDGFAITLVAGSANALLEVSGELESMARQAGRTDGR